MDDLIGIDPGQVRSVAPEFARTAGDLMTALRRLQDGLGGLGAYYGKDKQGQEFGAPYEQARRAIGDAIAKIADGVCSAQEGLQAMATTHEGIDDHTGATLGQIGGWS